MSHDVYNWIGRAATTQSVVTVQAKTWFFARQKAAAMLGVAPEEVVVSPENPNCPWFVSDE